MADVLRALNGNASEAQNIMKAFASSEPTNDQVERTLKELKDFHELGRDVIVQTLKIAKWNVDEAIPILFEKLEAKKAEERKKYEKERKTKESAAREESNKLLTDIFAAYPQAELRRILDENDGNVDLTIEYIFKLQKQEEENKQQQEGKTIKELVMRFNLTEKEVTVIYEKHNKNLETTIGELLHISKLRKFMTLFPRISPETISQTLVTYNYDDNSCIYMLNNIDANQPQSSPTPDNPNPKPQPQPQPQPPKQQEMVNHNLNVAQEIANTIDRQNPHLLAAKALERTLRLEVAGTAFLEDTHDVVDRSPAHNVVPVAQTQNNNNQQKNQIQLQVTPQDIHYGDNIQVTWESENISSSNDWIAIYHESDQNVKSYQTYQWVQPNATGGSIVFTAPSIPGIYFFKYLVNSTYESVMTSSPVRVGPAFKLFPTVLNEKQVKIDVEQLSGKPCPNAWVAAFEVGLDNKNYTTYEWVSAYSTLTFSLPKSGKWEFRLFPEKAYHHVASCVTNLNGSDSLSLSINNGTAVIKYNVLSLDPAKDGPWIGIYHVTESDNRQWRRYKYVTDPKGEIVVKAMQTSGTYEARLFAYKSHSVLARSNTVVVQ